MFVRVVLVDRQVVGHKAPGTPGREGSQPKTVNSLRRALGLRKRFASIQRFCERSD